MSRSGRQPPRGPDVGDPRHERLRERIAPEATLARASRTLLSDIPDPSELAISRVRARFLASRAAEPRMGRAMAPRLAAGLSLLAAAGLAWIQLQPAPAPPPAPISGRTVLAGESQLEPMTEVVLEYGGNGNAEWEDKVVRIDWEYGAITGDVEHGQGIDLSVHTREGVVKVVGTRFTVTRDASGSNITVDHGVVEVTCDGGPDATVTDGESHRCPPVSAGQWTSNVDRLLLSGKDAETVNAAIGRGLQYATADAPVRGELLARRIQLHLREDDLQSAAAVAQQYLDEGFVSRAAELQPLAALHESNGATGSDAPSLAPAEAPGPAPSPESP